MSKITLPDAVEVPDFAATRLAWLTRYAELMEVEVADLDDNDPAVKLCEAGAYIEVLRLDSINAAVRNTMLASAFGAKLDDLGADPLYGDTTRLVLDPGDEEAVPPIPPTYESDDDYRERLRLAPAALSVAGPSGAYESLALAAHADVVDVEVSSPDPCEILVEVLHDSDDPDILTDVEAALSDENKRPVGDRVTVQSATKEESTVEITVYVKPGPDLDAVQEASQARVDEIVLPLCAKVGSGATLSEGDENAWLGACVVEGVTAWEVTASTGMSDPAAAWWPMTITVTAVRSNA